MKLIYGMLFVKFSFYTGQRRTIGFILSLHYNGIRQLDFSYSRVILASHMFSITRVCFYIGSSKANITTFQHRIEPTEFLFG